MSGLNEAGRTGGELFGQRQKSMLAVPGDAFHTVLLSHGKLLHQRDFFKTLSGGIVDSLLQSVGRR